MNCFPCCFTSLFKTELTLQTSIDFAALVEKAKQLAV